MGMQTDVKSAYRTTDGTIFGAPARIKGILISPSTSAGSLVLKDGGTGGATVFEINWPSNTTPAPFNIIVPAEGIRCETDIYADVTTLTSITVFYG
jgi:hypothetical protein